MKKILLALVAAVTISTAASAQQTIGGNLNFCDSEVGIGVRYTYQFDNWRLAPEFVLFFPDNMTLFHINANVHYTFNVAPKFNLYPLAGLWVGYAKTKKISGNFMGVPYTIPSQSETQFGLNIGGGGEYEITSNLAAYAELKGILGDGSAGSFALGLAYKF